ncbi:MAG: ABC transporter ATP-binding protein [Thermoguttaceae bacterium]|jgi:putative ABC transport system ATP-binding protein
MNETRTACQDRTTEPLLRIDSVSRQFDGGSVQALRDVSLAIGRGEYLAIMGPSGSGKSTLLNLIGALDRPDRGEILFEGQSLSGMANPAHFRARTLGFIFQSFHLLPTLTALENVQIPMFAGVLPARQRVSKAETLLAVVGMSHRAGHLPPKLSVGERQRVAIARSLANDPPLLLADEPTGNLDSAASAGVLDLFDALRQQQGVTLVVITHSREVAARAQRTVWIRDGQLYTTPPGE